MRKIKSCFHAATRSNRRHFLSYDLLNLCTHIQTKLPCNNDITHCLNSPNISTHVWPVLFFSIDTHTHYYTTIFFLHFTRIKSMSVEYYGMVLVVVLVMVMLYPRKVPHVCKYSSLFFFVALSMFLPSDPSLS